MNVDRVASIADLLLGAWLFASMFLWRHSPEQMANAGIIGVAGLVLGFVALRGLVWARWIVGGLAVWLFVSAWFLPGTTVGTVLNHLIVATLMFGFSVLPTGRGESTVAPVR